MILRIFALLALLLQHPGRVVTQPQLLRELWGPDHQHDTHYLRILVGKLRQKLGDDATAPRYIAKPAFRCGVFADQKTFGASRCMFESNFPVDKGSYGYQAFWNACKILAKGASASEKAAHQVIQICVSRARGARLVLDL